MPLGKLVCSLSTLKYITIMNLKNKPIILNKLKKSVEYFLYDFITQL